MTARPTVSVVMPVRNPHAGHFPAAIRSLLAQSLASIEVLVVEDAGPRRDAAPPAPVAPLLETVPDPRIRHLRNDTAGIASARNLGIATARAPLVAMLDADDISLPERLAAQAERMEHDPTLAVLGSQLQIIDERDQRIGTRRYPTTHEAIVRQMPVVNPIAQPSVMLRKAAVEEIGGYRDRTCEDYDLWSRLARAGARFANLEDALVRYRIHGGAMKSRQLRASLRDTIEIKREHWRGHQPLAGHLRLWGERAMLVAPRGMVMVLFRRLYLRDREPA